MYRRPKFIQILLEIRQEMAHEAEYDVVLFTELARSGTVEKKPFIRKTLVSPDEPSLESSEESPIGREPHKIQK
jgi:hypothetical protein